MKLTPKQTATAEAHIRELLMLSGQIPAEHLPDRLPTPEQIARARQLPADSFDGAYERPWYLQRDFEAGQNQRS